MPIAYILCHRQWRN